MRCLVVPECIIHCILPGLDLNAVIQEDPDVLALSEGLVWAVQAMDRAHRIGQDNPVLVLRLATGNSVDGRMLKRANSKLMLERLVIRKGAFLPSEAKQSQQANLTNEELMELLKDTMPLKNEPQSGIVTDQVHYTPAFSLHVLSCLCLIASLVL